MTLLIAMFMPDAFAAQVNVTLCGVVKISYTDIWDTDNDGIEDNSVDDDYFSSNHDRPARGAFLRVTDNTTGIMTEHQLEDDNPACTASTVQLDTTRTYKLVLTAKATLNGNNTIKVWTNDVDDAMWAHVGETAWTPVAGTKTLTTGTHAAWNILAASSWALHRRNGGLANETLIFYTETCPTSPGASCYSSANQRLYIDPAMDEGKYFVCHEMGHKIARLRDGGLIPNKPALASPDGVCQASDGPMIQKRFPALAADEGLAWYYSVVAFNDTTGTDCGFFRSGHDWDQDGTSSENLAPANLEQTPSCDGDVAEGWADEDYLGVECGGTLEDRGTYVDWMRAFWDVDNEEGLSTATIFDLWVEADPSTWDGDGGSGCDLVDLLPCDPQERMEQAAIALGVSVEWNAVDGRNGIR